MKNLINKSIIKARKGFTLIEMLIVFSVLSVVLSAIVGYFISIIKTQNYILASQQLYDQTSYAMDYMYKIIRMTKKDKTASFVSCASAADYNFNPSVTTTPSSSLQFLKVDRVLSEKVCQKFELVGSTIQTTIGPPGGGIGGGITSPLTSNDIIVTKLQFNVEGDGGTAILDKVQPRVTITLEAHSKRIPTSTIKLQTTVSQRDPDIDG